MLIFQSSGGGQSHRGLLPQAGHRRQQRPPEHRQVVLGQGQPSSRLSPAPNPGVRVR